MLVGHDIVLVFWVDGLVLGRDKDLVVGQPVFADVFKEVGVARVVHVHRGVAAVFVLASERRTER